MLMISNLFVAAAANSAKKVTTKRDDKTVVVVPEETHENFSEKLQRLAKLKTLMDEYEAESKSLECDIKEEGRKQFLSLYNRRKLNPGSFVLEGEKGGKFLLITMDKYLSIDSDRAEEIKASYGEEFVEQKIEYKFDIDILNKHMDAISEAIMGCTSMSDEEKAALIVPDVKNTIAKGSIDKLMQIKEEERTGFFYNIQPIIQLKNCK